MVEFRPAGLGVWFGLVLGSLFLSPPSVCSSLPSTMTWAPCPHGVRTRGKKHTTESSDSLLVVYRVRLLPGVFGGSGSWSSQEECPVLPSDGQRRQRRRPVSMEEYTGRERSPPPDPAGSAAAEIPVPNSPTPTGRTFQDNFNSAQMPASPTGGQGLTQEALIEVLRNQHQNIVQQQNLIAGQGEQISELTKLVSGLVQMQTDVLKDQA